MNSTFKDVNPLYYILRFVGVEVFVNPIQFLKLQLAGNYLILL